MIYSELSDQELLEYYLLVKEELLRRQPKGSAKVKAGCKGHPPYCSCGKK